MNNGFTIMAVVILGMATAFAATMLFGAVYFAIGLLTGVYGMCMIAPDWWQKIYLKPCVRLFQSIIKPAN